MKTFQQWLLNEIGQSAQITVKPGLTTPIEMAGGKVTKTANEEDIKQITRQALQAYYQKHDPQAWQFLKARYNFHIDDVNDYADTLTLKINIIPQTPLEGEEEEVAKDHPAYDYYQKFHKGMTGKTVYKTPKDAIQEIPQNPNLAYRGMAWEEWQSIRKTNTIQSKGHYNIGQEGYTMFGYIPETGLHYAHGFAPLPYQVGHKRPGVVIAVPRNLLKTHKDDPDNIPDNELGLQGPLSKDHITHAWMMTMNKANKNQGFIELRFKWTPDWNQKNYKDPRQGFFTPNFNKPNLGNAMLSGGVEYAIRQMF